MARVRTTGLSFPALACSLSTSAEAVLSAAACARQRVRTARMSSQEKEPMPGACSTWEGTLDPGRLSVVGQSSSDRVVPKGGGVGTLGCSWAGCAGCAGWWWPCTGSAMTAGRTLLCRGHAACKSGSAQAAMWPFVYAPEGQEGMVDRVLVMVGTYSNCSWPACPCRAGQYAMWQAAPGGRAAPGRSTLQSAGPAGWGALPGGLL